MLQLFCGNPRNGCFPVDQPFLHHFAGNSNSGQSRALPIARLQHEDFAVLDRELEVLHVLEVGLKDFANALQFFVRLRQMRRELLHWLRRANASHNIFALGIDQELAVKNFFAGGWIAREGYA